MPPRREEEAGPRQRKADGSDQRTGARTQSAMRSFPPPTPDRGAANVLQALAQKG
jgi:hypothetical protein